MGEKTKKLRGDPETSVTIMPENNVFSKSPIWVERSNFYGDDHKVEDEPYLIIGFDTEYKSPSDPVSREQVKAGLAKFTVLSYQFHCSLYDPEQPEAKEWSGICFPNVGGGRLKLADVLTFAFFEGIRTQSIKLIPSRIYLVGHFTRADVPAFEDFQTLTELISSVRNTFLSIRYYLPLIYFFPGGGTVELKVTLRDTWLLTPAASKSLRVLGELVGLEKIVLDPDPAIEQHHKEHMDELLRDDPELYVKYAINDAVICTRYLEHVIRQYHDLLGLRRAPATLSSIGVNLLLQFWKESKFDSLDLLGKQKIKQNVYSKRRGYFLTKAIEVDLEQVHLHKALATESYHGGRNEQFWFGPAFEDNWTDYDLAGAYPTAMALIGKPDWRASYVSTKIADYTPTTLGIASVDFEFPRGTRFPTLPVRTDNGLVFPLKGTSYCAAPEIALAKSLGAHLTVRHGVVIPTDPAQLIFGNFIRKCIERRQRYPKGSLENLFWKELTNSTYGKTAQGLRMKRVYDSQDREMKPLPASQITNPYFASYITSFVRASLGEIMNRLPAEVCVFSCTTDGFLTNATAAQIGAASQGPLAGLYRDARLRLTHDPAMLEIKHQIRKPLGWRTRGQATLIPGTTEQG